VTEEEKRGKGKGVAGEEREENGGEGDGGMGRFGPPIFSTDRRPWT